MDGFLWIAYMRGSCTNDMYIKVVVYRDSRPSIGDMHLSHAVLITLSAMVWPSFVHVLLSSPQMQHPLSSVEP